MEQTSAVVELSRPFRSDHLIDTLMVKTRVKIAQSGAPQASVAGPRAGEKRSVSRGAEGRKTETVEVKPSVPLAQ
ncbi:hypothetical protein [Streptomyces sp. NPDC058665]|uniref:hypothetical protein n=1 Tax=Streptomyces sp. NPDC058665 TaxID=3346586 RepID=UPI0036689021